MVRRVWSSPFGEHVKVGFACVAVIVILVSPVAALVFA